jgi:voltage-gated potassium channel
MNALKDIILFGYGSFGRQIYKHLSLRGHKVRVVSSNDKDIVPVDGDDVVITKINIKKNDDILDLNIDADNTIFYCAMDRTANNLFLVLTLKSLFPGANVIAISNSNETTRKLKYAGASSVIDLYEATSRRIVSSMTKPAVARALDEIVYNENDLKMLEIEIPDDSFLEGKFVSEIQFRAMGIILIAIIDKELGYELVFTDHRINHKLDSGDILVIVAKQEDIQKFQQLLEKKYC